VSLLGFKIGSLLGDIRDRIANSEIFMFWAATFLGGGTPKFLTQFKKLRSPPNMWQSLVTIGPETSEITWRKKYDRNHRSIL